ncbi:arginase [Pedobacter frigoris]|uniref:Arginase n=1 Tax=Pedobacter frigoris TaxID=2571272 RepID=A0A4U1CPI4_9SPHI|nr:arginase [Pedobacter frigoris]TKC09166.1 arginase [Pedobacter frigoris]
MRKSIKIIKNRSDIGAGTRGSDMGVDAIEIAAINKGSQYFNNFPFIEVQTRNESVYRADQNVFAKRIEEVKEQCDRLAAVVQQTLTAGEFPLIFSGDHSSAIGSIAGIKATYPEKTLGVIWIDAHADLHSPYTTPSGNLHGMPLAATIGEDNLSCKINDVPELTAAYWEHLKNIGVSGPKIKPEHLVYFGVRDTEESEDILIQNVGIKNYQVAEIRSREMDVCVQEALAKLSDCDFLYVSFDVDSMDCDLISDGTGTPVPKGFDQQEIIAMTEQLIGSDKVICFEVVEVNPLLDHKGNRMAEVTFEILEHITQPILIHLLV